MMIAVVPLGPLVTATSAGAAVTVGTNITAFPDRDMIVAVGYEPGEALTVEVERAGVVIGRTAGPAVETPEGVGLETNHGPLNTAQPGDCWQGVTPDIIGGDLIRVTTPRGVDTMTVAGVGFTAEPQLGAGGEVFVEGTASAPDGSRLPASDVAVELRRDKPDPRFRRGPFVPVYQGDTGNSWRATFTPSTTTSPEGLTPEQQRSIALTEASWLAVVDNITETTIAELGETGGPAPGCEAAPAEPNAIASGYQQPINVASGDILLSGTAREGVSDVSITIGDQPPRSATVSTNPTGVRTWSLRVPKVELEPLPDGTVTIRSSYDGLAGSDRTVLKDTVAPLAATASPPAGTYSGTQQVTLNKPPGEQQSSIRWEIGDATVPDPDETSNLFVAQIAVSATQTLKARVIDRAGNTGPVATFAYRIGTPTTAPTGVAAAERNASASITWSSVTGAVSYNVYRDGAATPVNSAPLTTTSFTDTPLAPATYSYVVRALESNGIESEGSAPATVTVAAPAEPVGLTGTAGDARATLRWTANTEGDLGGYRVYREGTPGPIATLTATATQYIDTGLTNGQVYSYSISAVDRVGNESARTGIVQVAPTAPPAPAAPQVSPLSGTYASAQTVTMSAAPGATIRFTVGTGATVPPDPTATTGTVYSGPVGVSTSSVIKAVAVSSSGQVSPVTRRDYTIQTATTRTVTITANADTMVRQASPTATAGAARTLSVDNDLVAGNNASRATSYVRFTVPALAAGESITSARLSLRATNATNNGPAVWRTGTGWNEATTSWNTGQPGRVGTAPVGNFASMALARTSVAVSGITAAGQVSFQLFSESTDNLIFASSENGTVANRPQLVLTITRP